MESPLLAKSIASWILGMTKGTWMAPSTETPIPLKGMVTVPFPANWSELRVKLSVSVPWEAGVKVTVRVVLVLLATVRGKEPETE
jgi:hypothetical protein